MDNIVSIRHQKENVLEFELTIEGVEGKDPIVKLVIQGNSISLGFGATKKEKTTWQVKIPKLSILEKTAYPFHIEVLVDGYYFEAFKGTVNVLGSAEIYSSEPKNITIQPSKQEKPSAPKKEDSSKKSTTKSEEQSSKKKEPPKEVKTPVEKKKTNENVHTIEKSIEQIANDLLKQHKFDPENVEKKIGELGEHKNNSKDEKVLAILEEAGIRPKYGKRPRISFISTKAAK